MPSNRTYSQRGRKKPASGYSPIKGVSYDMPPVPRASGRLGKVPTYNAQRHGARVPGPVGTGVRGGEYVSSSTRKANPRSVSGGGPGPEVQQDTYKKNGRTYHVWYSGGRRHVRSFVSNKNPSRKLT